MDRMMKKIITSLTLLMVFFVTFAVGARTATISDSATQTITGFIDGQIYLSAQNISYSSDQRGIDLNFDNAENPVRNLISPTVVPLTHPGLQFGKFTVISSVPNYSVRITHTPLVRMRDSEGQPVTTGEEVDYELGINYTVTRLDENNQEYNENITKMCLSAGGDPNIADATKKILVDLYGVTMIQDAGVYFRLTSSSPVVVPGEYESTITFHLEPI